MIIIKLLIALAVIYFSTDFWRRGGNGNVIWRVCVGGIIGLGKVILFWNPLVIIYWLYFWAATAGVSYGDNSPTRIVWSWILKRDRQDTLVQIFTRATCGFVWSLAALCFIPFGGSLVKWVCYSVILTITNCTVVLFSKNVEVSERVAGGVTALAILV